MAPFDTSVMRTKEGIEYDVEQRGPSLYIIRKQDRQKRREGVMEVQQLSLYYCIYRFNRENPAISTLDILRAPDLGAIINFRMINMLYYLQEALQMAQKYRRYAPSAGYRWDFSKEGEADKEGEAAEVDDAKKAAEDEEPLAVTQEVHDFARQAGELWQMTRAKYPLKGAGSQAAQPTEVSTPRAGTPQADGSPIDEAATGGGAVKRLASQGSEAELPGSKRQKR